MNWMANSKNRVQKRRSTAVNIQRGYFARNNTLPLAPTQGEPAMRQDSNWSQQQENFGLRNSKCEFKLISNAIKGHCSSKDSSYSLPRIVKGKGFPAGFPEAPRASQSMPISNSVQQIDVPASRTHKSFREKKRRKSNYMEEGEYCHDDAELRETIDRLTKVISDQKNQIRLLEERCIGYESEPCVGRRSYNVDSGGPPSFHGSVEESPDRIISKCQGGTSDDSDQVYSIPRIEESRVEFKICAGAISCVNTNSQRANNTFSLVENYYVGTDTSRKLLFLHCSLDKRGLTESAHLQDYREMNSIQQAVLNVQQNMPLLNPLRLPGISRVELSNQ